MKIRHLLMSAALMAPMAVYAQQSTPTTAPAQNDTQSTTTGPKGHRGMHARRGDGDRESRMQEHFERMSKELNLTEDQKTQVKAVMEDQRSQMKALRADTSLTPDQRKDKAKQIRKASHEKMMAILNDEQKEKMKAMHEKREDRREKKDKDKDDMPKADNDKPKL